MQNLLSQLMAFFRPRSRSRSRTHLPSDSMPIAVDVPPSSFPKSSVRSQTRPISSTTTATHSTITPLPSDTRLNGARNAYAFHPHSIHSRTSLRDIDQANDPHDHQLPSEIPPPSKSWLLFHSLFGISFTRRSSASTSTPQHSASPSTSTSASDLPTKSSRKRSFRLTSRPTTPKSVDEPSSSKSRHAIPVPSSPLPLSASPRRRSFGLGSSQRSTPKSSTSNLPLPPTQVPQSSRSHARRHSVGSERPPHDSAVALSEESSHRGLHKTTLAVPDGGTRNKGKEREKPLPECPSIDFPSQSLPTDPSPISQKHSAGHPMFPHLPTVDSVSSEENEHSSLAPHRLPAIPRIIHTPPTPQRPGEGVDSLPRPGTSSLAVRSDKIAIAKPKTVTIAHQEQVIISTSQSLPDQQPSKGRFTPRIFGGKDLPKIKDSNGQQSRGRQPVRSSNGSHKTPASNVTSLARNMTNHRSKLGSFDFERPVSALNRSSSTVDQHRSRVSRDNSPCTKSQFHSLERTISEDSAPKSHSTAHQSGQAESSQINPVHTGETSVISFSSVSVQTMSTGKGMGSSIPTGQSSSWSRASGRRVLRTSHGTFAFEHPFSAPSSPNPQNSSLPTGPNQTDGQLSSVLQSKSKTPLHTIFDTRTKHSRGQSYNTPDSVEPGYPKRPQRKVKGKGRSLDLGLGLSWAPSRVREEVLMPGLILEKAKLEKSRANGSDVTKLFESILSESRFETFKECKDPCSS